MLAEYDIIREQRFAGGVMAARQALNLKEMVRVHPGERTTHGGSLTGKVPVSKTGGWGFESLPS